MHAAVTKQDVEVPVENESGECHDVTMVVLCDVQPSLAGDVGFQFFVDVQNCCSIHVLIHGQASCFVECVLVAFAWCADGAACAGSSKFIDL